MFYPNNLVCRWLLSSYDPQDRIKIDLKLQPPIGLARGDFLEFRDGDNENASLIHRFDDRKQNRLETSLTSTGNTMNVVFRSDKEFTGAGFKISYKSERVLKGKSY